MKFSTKLSLAITILLAVALSFGGTVLVRQNFTELLNGTVEQNIGQHLLERYSLESEMLSLTMREEEVSDERLVRYGASLNDYLGEGRKMIAFYDPETQGEIYSNFPSLVSPATRLGALEQQQDHYQLKRVDGNTVMLMATLVESPKRSVWLLSGYDITRVFTQRTQQLHNLWRISGIILAGGILVVLAMSRFLTRPIRRLNRVSRKIADGAYSVRTGVHTGDEIGQLARNFDLMAEAVEERVDELNRSVQQRDDFVSAFTHELKTPMTSIIGYSDLMRSMETDPKTRHTAANHIFHEAKRLEALSQKLLGLMGLSENELALVPVKVASIYAGVQRSLRPLPADIQLEFAPCSVQVMADRDLCIDLLRNLILNGIKAQPKDGRIRVMARVQEARCHLAVYDTGCGIPEEELSRIVEPFYMVDKSRARDAGGTGIGLALCSKIAELHGGALRFQSKVGEGTLVSFSLPLYREEAP